jgi:hypothetical protein
VIEKIEYRLLKKFIVIKNAWDYEIDAILSQGKIDQEKPYAYVLRFLRGSEHRYSTYDNELLVIVFAKEQFRHYLYESKITVVADQELLKNFKANKHLYLRFKRLQAALRTYKFEIMDTKRHSYANVHSCRLKILLYCR